VTEPYIDIDLGDGFTRRYFQDTVEELDLIWHRDEKDREVRVVRSNNWQFQFDNELPFTLEEGNIINISAMVYHRIIKGGGVLELMIQEK
jgi:hypothetical protein